MASRKRNYLGLSLGRSGLGVEAALVEAWGGKRRLSFARRGAGYVKCDPVLREDLLAWMASGRGEGDRPWRKLARLCGTACEQVCRRSGVEAGELFALGWLGPDAQSEGFGAALAEEMELPVACGFAAGARQAGGEACLVEAWPMWQRVKDAKLSRAVVRLGWMARLYFVGAGAEEVEVVAGDLGPAGVVLDALAREHFDLACDVDGAMAAKGRVLPEMLNELLSHAWFQRSLPKLARSSDWSHRYRKRLEMISRNHGGRPQDEVATVTEMVARLVDRAVSGLTERPHQVALTGGGSANITLAGRIRELLSPCSTVSAAVLGLDSRSSRAEAAAMLAAARHAGREIWSPQATGACCPGVLGTWLEPGRV